MATVSVVIPTLNRRELLRRAVGSALAQTGVEVEILIADDGSTDGTREEWTASGDGRIRLLPLEHGGACRARNRGVAAATGEYIAFLDSDDTWVPDKLAKQIRFLEDTGADAVFSAFRHWDNGVCTVRPGEEILPGRIRKEQLLLYNFVSTQTVLGRSECLREVPFDERFPRMQDWEFALRLTERFHVEYSHEPLADVYLQGDSLSRNPGAALEAVRMIAGEFRDDYAGSFAATRKMAGAMNLYARQSGQRAWGDMAKLTARFLLHKRK